MELMECIKNRRSIRSFESGEVAEEVLRDIIGAAIMAPSWKNSQVSRFYVAASEKSAEQLRRHLPEFNQISTKNAGAVIVTTVVKGRSGFERDGSYSSHLKDGWQYFDNALAVQNLCLCAYEHGLGTLIMGLYDADGVRGFFDIPDTEEIVAVIAVGNTGITPEMPKRKTVDEVAKFFA